MQIWWTAGLLLLSGGISAAQDLACDQDKSRAEVQRLIQAGTIASVDQFPPFITVVVNDRPWSRLDLEAKKAMAQHVDCSMAGPGSTMLRTVLFRSKKDNRQLGVYSKGQLTVP